MEIFFVPVYVWDSLGCYSSGSIHLISYFEAGSLIALKLAE